MTLRGQSYSFKHYQVENGLSNNAVICSLQDHRGFLWFGTKDGLNRFDGYRFKVFRHNPDDSNSVGNNFIYCLYEDAGGTLWIGTERGLYKYNDQSESFHVIPATAALPVSEVTVGKDKTIWFTSGLTLSRYSEASGKLTTFDAANYFEATGICTTADGTVWAASANGLLQRFDAAKKAFRSFPVFARERKVTSKWIEKIKAGGNNTILIGTGNDGFKLFDTNTGTLHSIELEPSAKTDLFVRDFLQTSPDEYWVGTEKGIFIYNNSTGKTAHLTKQYNDPYSLSDDAVYSFCLDKEGGLWAGTYFGGINYHPKQNTPFKRYFPKPGENSLSGNVVREIRKDKEGNLWIGTEDAGLNKLDAAGHFTHFMPTGEKGSLSYSNIHGLLLRGDELWVGTFEHGLDVLNTKTGKVVRHYGVAPGSALRSNFIFTLYQTRGGEILVGTTIGLYRFNAQKNDFDPIPELPLYNWYTSVVHDANGVLWSATYGNGVNYLETKTGKSGNLHYDAKDKGSLSSDRVNAIFEDSQERLWFATENGLCQWNPAVRKFKRYGTADGFPSNFMIKILEDEKGVLWISTTKGLVSFHPAKMQVKIYTTANGLLSDQFNFCSAYKDETGRMYFGSAKGLISFDPATFGQTTFTPPVYITGFQINNQEISIGNGSSFSNAITFTNKLTLANNQSTFSIDFAALSYTAPEMLEYAYKMDGLYTGWTYLKKNRKVYFTELSPGTYTFRIKATNSSGIWNNKETKLTIVVLPPWWKSWWAYGLYVLFVVVAIGFLVRNYHRRMQEKARRNLELLQIAKEKEIYEAKMEFFTNVAHEIRTPLTLIKGPLEKVIRIAGGIPEIATSLKIMDRNTARLIDLTNQLLDFRQTEINGLRLSFVNTNISALMEETYQSFAALAEQKGLRFSQHLPQQPLEAFVDVEAFSKILYNLYGNAVKYAESNVEIDLQPHPKDDSTFTVQVKNDGFLIPDQLKEKIFEPFYRIRETGKQKGTGIGLALSRSLAQLHNGELVLNEPENGMNCFTLTLPIRQEVEFTPSSQSRPVNSVTTLNSKP